MFRNYLTVALRNIVRNKLYSFINIAGLAVGLACAIFIILFVRDELSFDKWVPDSTNLYRVNETFLLPGRPPIVTPRADFPLPALLKDNLPEVTAMTRFWPIPRTVMVGNRAFSEDVVEVDSDFFRVIRLPLLAGDPSTILTKPDSVVLSQAAAHKFFGAANPVGRILAVNKASCDAFAPSCANEAVALRVSGVMRDLPHNTHLRGEILIPHTSTADSVTEDGKKRYYSVSGYGYVRLAPGSDPAAVAAKIPGLLDRHVDVLNDLGMKLKARDTIQIRLVPFTAAHLDEASQIGNMVPPGSRITLYGLGVIGVLILLVACFNFTNLATARAMGRAREIALRKCAGARPAQIVRQFLGESVLTALFALVLSLSLAEILLPAYDSFLARPVAFHYLADWPLLLLIVGIAVAAGLASGFYPALVLSRFQPAPVLRANNPGHTGSSPLRTILVVLQFTVAIGLAIVALAVFSQVNFARNQSLGFRRDNVLVVNTFRSMTASARDSFVERLRAHPGILDVAKSTDIPFSGNELVAQMRLPGGPEYLTMHREGITPEYFRLYDMRLVAGRFLSDARGEDRIKNYGPFGNDGRNILINHAAAVRFGFTPIQAVGQTVLFGDSHVRIAGVIGDAHIDGAREQPRPTIYLNDSPDSAFLSVRIAGGHIPEALKFVDETWRRFVPNVAINRHFLDDSFEKLYLDDQKQGQMLGAFVAVAILIACLGLFGLAAFTASRRTQEIGIRKVFGARTRDIAFLLLWQFSLPVILANLLAWPLAWYYLQDWLKGFDYRITLSPLYFAAAGLAALMIAWATILSHALRVARANPIHALRYE
jgi:putative ABC transport system permease protein